MTIHNRMYDQELSGKSKKPTVMVSGGFDPVHAGHIRMIRHAAEFGDVIIIANSDDWLFRKKVLYLWSGNVGWKFLTQ